ncbi:alpha/beta hydrolase [Vibrio diabolicus]|nr:alpha/beta hydrolase [Vibrio diabolicus]
MKSQNDNQASYQDEPDEGRRNMMKMTGASVVAMGVGSLSTSSVQAETQINLGDTWDKTFTKSNQVQHRKVSFKNRYGIMLAADLYRPKNKSGKLAAIVISGPFGAVKEQSSGLYAQTLADRGFITLAFDPSYTGESGGEPRNVASPDINTEDFSAAVDFIGLQNDV